MRTPLKIDWDTGEVVLGTITLTGVKTVKKVIEITSELNENKLTFTSFVDDNNNSGSDLMYLEEDQVHKFLAGLYQKPVKG